jgi:hypothetical protein
MCYQPLALSWICSEDGALIDISAMCNLVLLNGCDSKCAHAVIASDLFDLTCSALVSIQVEGFDP